MNTAQPIRNPEELKQLKCYYRNREYNPRNQLLISLGLNTALRISDILALRWKDVYYTDSHRFKSHIELVEHKTGKRSRIYMNESILKALRCYRQYHGKADPGAFLFEGKDNGSLSRVQAWRVIRHAAQQCGISGVISPHSLRKTFGYLAWKNGTSPVLLMEIFNHSSFAITKRYLGIGQEDRDEVFRNICI